MKIKGSFIIIAAVVAVLLYNAAYVVDETEQVVITQFGRIIGDPKTAPGLKFKIPFIQQANFFAKNLLDWDGDPGQVQTLDKRFIWEDTFARWKIVDPVKFFQTVNNQFKRFLAKKLACWIKGILKLRPGVVLGSPIILPNWVMTTCSVSSTI